MTRLVDFRSDFLNMGQTKNQTRTWFFDGLLLQLYGAVPNE